jgi:hypothetical protein
MGEDGERQELGRRARVVWWVVAVGLIVAVVVVAWVRDDEPTLTADQRLEAALLTSGDFRAGYDVAVMGQDRLDQAVTAQELPSGIRPAECAELLRAQPRPAEDTAVGAVEARGDGVYYVEVVTPAAGMPEWDPGRVDEVVDACGTTTFDQDGTTGTVRFDRIEGVRGDGFALRATISVAGDSGAEDEVSLGVAVSRVDGHVVVLTGGATGDLDEAEFVRLANAANARVSVEL